MPGEVHDAERLKELQSMPLERKVGFTIARITECHNHFNGKCYISFSGGKDSTVLLYIARKLYPEIPAVFVDTGLEFPEIRDFVKTWDNVTWLRPAKSFYQVINEYGYPLISKDVSQCIYEGRKFDGTQKARFYDTARAHRYNGRYSLERYRYLFESDIPISDRCCKILKKTPAHEYEKETGRCPIIATMTEESKLRRTKWLKYGCNSFESKRPTSNPMSFWTDQDVLEYLQTMHIPIASIYGEITRDCNGNLTTTGRRRTGCMYYLFGIKQDKTPNRIQMLHETHPKIYNYLIEKLHYDKIMDFIGVDWRPIKQPSLF